MKNIQSFSHLQQLITCVMWAKSMRAEREDCSIIAGGIGCIGGIIRSSPVAGNFIAVAKDRIKHEKMSLNIIKTKYF